MKKHSRSTRPRTLNEAKVRLLEPEALAYAKGGGGQVYPATEYDALPSSPYRPDSEPEERGLFDRVQRQTWRREPGYLTACVARNQRGS